MKGYLCFIFCVGGPIIDFYKAAQGVNTAVYWGADVVSMSFVSPAGFACGNLLVVCDLRSAVQAAVNSGVVVLGAGGNEGVNSSRAPADWPEVIGIGALNTFVSSAPDNRASYSNYGWHIDLWAPGTGYSLPVPQNSCYVSSRCFYSDYQQFSFSGTSAATPYAAGVVALLKQVAPSYNQAQILNVLLATARPSPDPTAGPIIDARAALWYLGARP